MASPAVCSVNVWPPLLASLQACFHTRTQLTQGRGDEGRHSRDTGPQPRSSQGILASQTGSRSVVERGRRLTPCHHHPHPSSIRRQLGQGEHRNGDCSAELLEAAPMPGSQQPLGRLLIAGCRYIVPQVASARLAEEACATCGGRLGEARAATWKPWWQ